MTELRVQWVPEHHNFAPNKRVDELAKDAAKGSLSLPKDLPAFLRKPLPASISALHQESKSKTQWLWSHHWKTSPQYQHMGAIDTSTPSKSWLELVWPLSRKQVLIILQLHTGHTGLNHHLHRIKCSNTPNCPNCDANTTETVHHFLFKHKSYRHKHSILHHKLCHLSLDLSYLLSHPSATLPLLRYIHATGHLKQTFRAVCSDSQLAAQNL